MRTQPSVRVAALADIHLKNLWDPAIARAIRSAADNAEILLICGDITDNGRLREFETAAAFFATIDTPIFAVLGNHDRRGFRKVAMKRILREGSVDVLDGERRLIVSPRGVRVGIVGACGTGGGFGTTAESHGYSRRFASAVGVKARRENLRFQRALIGMEADAPDVRLCCMHFSPIPETLVGEPPIKYWMLGNAIYSDSIDQHPVDVVFHGHAHAGTLAGTTPGGVPVRNVAIHVAGGVMVYDIGPDQRVEPVQRIDIPTPGAIRPADQPAASVPIRM